MRSANLDVQWERSLDRQSDIVRLIELVATRHDHEDIDLAVGVRFAVGVRAEEDDLVRIEPLGDFAGKTADDRLRHVCTAIPACRFLLRCSATFDAHSCIVSKARAGYCANCCGGIYVSRLILPLDLGVSPSI